MNGVDILVMEEVAVAFAFNWQIFWIIAGLMTLGGLSIGVILYSNGCYEWLLIPELAVTFLAVGVIFGTAAGMSTRIPTKYETQYKVTISDEVPMTDFLEKYEIIETEGKIYTVREKGADAK